MNAGVEWWEVFGSRSWKELGFYRIIPHNGGHQALFGGMKGVQPRAATDRCYRSRPLLLPKVLEADHGFQE
eukprot:scaffold4274_cov175-Amphora_coffeaeformis.AAC.12